MNGCKPNKAMQRRHDIMREIGCIICKRGGIYTPCQIHHITGTKTQADHARTLGLCPYHHMGEQLFGTSPEYVSRHPNKKAFEREYDQESDLLIEQNKLIEEYEKCLG